MQDLNDIYYFAKIVEHGSLSAASEALGISKSVLSQHLARLEEQLGMRLIERTTRRLHVTDIGQRYYERCRLVLEELDQAARVIEDVRETPRGRVRITSPVNATQTILAPILAGFMTAYPEVEVTLDIANREVDLIQEGYHLALRIGSEVPSCNAVTRSFSLNEHLLVASPALLQRTGTPRTPDDLKSMPSVGGAVPAERTGHYVWDLEGPDGTKQSIPHAPRFLTEDLWVIMEAVLAGCGIGALPPLVTRGALDDGRLVHLLPEWQLPRPRLHLVYPPRRGLTLAVRTLIDYVSAHLPPALDATLKRTLTFHLHIPGEPEPGSHTRPPRLGATGS